MGPEDRRAAVVRAAHALIAERGLEGFRVRLLAERVGISHATLLHYFPSKQAIIEAVVDDILQQLRAEATGPPPASPRDALRRELADFGRRFQRDPAFFAVLNELQLRAARDPHVARPLDRLLAAWRQHLTSLVGAGVAAGQFHPAPPPAAVADVVIALLRGLTLQAGRPGEEDAVGRTLAAIDRLVATWPVPGANPGPS